MNDWVKPPYWLWQYRIWYELFPTYDLDKGYTDAVYSPTGITVARMEKFTQACVVAKLKGEHLK